MSQLNASKVIKVAVITPFRSAHYVSITNNDGTTMKIHNAAVVRAFLQGFGMPFEIVMPKDDEFGSRMSNGTWTGIVGMIKRGEADITVPAITCNKETSQFYFFLYMSDITFITNKPEPHPKEFAVFETFSFEMWIGIVIILLFMSLLLYLLLKKRQPYFSILISIIGSLLEKSFPFEERRGKVAFLLIFWFLGVTILTNGYKAVILCVITFPKLVGIRDISDLAKAAEKGKVTCMSYPGGEPNVPWFDTNDDKLISIGKCMKRSEMRGLTSHGPFRKYSRKKPFIADRLDIITYGRDYEISEDSFAVSQLGIVYSKTFCCPRKLESIVHQITAADIYAKAVRDREYMAQLRVEIREPPGYDRTLILPLKLPDFTGVFLVLFIGLLLSFTVFLVVILGMKRYRMKKLPTGKFMTRSYIRKKLCRYTIIKSIASLKVL